MQIGELAKKSGCDAETVRYYEREGLLPAPARTASGYRRYEQPHLEQLAFIRHCRSLDMSLADIRRLQDYHLHPSAAPCDDINALLDAQIGRIHQQIASLQRLEQQLLTLRARCDAPHTVADCGILKTLEGAASGEGCVCHDADAPH
ncbi:Cd(II)/Pb(II)-responsive transcriptional regulator [Vogesella sp. LIG4]|uniref:Cd(II)/Pb(II)-responsive transcriptional regulator n=1 Tax=Vogesella sp. LIG4 TaxID=1192162 RepID=UPI00081FC4C6|nr:Cd(II)/Pb(II)-responsive transcriptional regulator [Vogesella sp. LIG4]SCK04939.1 Cd(II)/Pb(II)-responsive transcriptional regulator [Vogesella sp. LIG4]